ncbi:MAG: ddc 2 [Gemmatimonadetes bacterium]|nr:ddc 2 [Gemmatimonadota bacterium]
MTQDSAPLAPLGDTPPDVLRRELRAMADWAASYRESIGSRAISPSVRPGDITARLTATIPDDADSTDAILRDLDAVIMPGIVHWGHPAFLGYFGSTSNGPALLGEIAAAALNVSAMTWRTSPAATELETVVLQWIRELVGLPRQLTGIVYDTASVALVHALAAARERALPGTRARGLAGRDELRVQRVYASEQAHSSIEKAMVVLGLGEDNVVRIPCDDAFRLDVAALERAIRADRELGLQPLAVVATIGTTSTASVDPVAEIAAVCGEEHLWLHVDAAYGGAIGVLPEGRALLDGVSLADSVVVNPHKWLFVPLDFSALFVKHPELLRSVFALTPEYLEGDAAGEHAPDGARIDYMDYGIQLGRRFRALKAWMVLRAFGRSGLVARIREHCRLAELFAERVRGDRRFELAAPRGMAIVCFRSVLPGRSREESDALDRSIVEAVNASGDAYLTHTVLHGRVAMRVGFGNVLTTEEHLASAWASVVRERDRLLV